MAIRVTRNETGNCINFVGSTQPAYWNACLSAQANSNNPDNIDIVNDIISDVQADTVYEFFNVPYTEFADKDGNVFADAQTAIDYINANANVTGLSTEVGKDMTGVDINFRLDETTTTVLLDNGFSFAVNSIKAVGDADGTVHIHAISTGTPEDGTEADRKHLEKIEVGRAYLNGTVIAGGLNDVVNTLNELFTVGAFTAVVITDPAATTIADVQGTDTTYTLEGNTAVDPAGDAIFTNSSSGNYAGLKTVDTINQAGEYFTFDIQNEGQIGFGLIHSDASYAGGYYTGTATYADPATFAVSNSAHYGYQFSHWFHPTPNGSWTNYGASTGFIRGGGWYNWESQDEWLAGDAVKVKVGIDENGFIAIYTLQDNDTDWILHARTSYPVAEGAEFHLGIKCQDATPRVLTTPKVHLLAEAAPTMYFRYIESPDGIFQYPIFATEEEANYYDTDKGGSGTSTQRVFADDPTFTTWYTPDTGYTNNGSAAPVAETFDGNQVTYTEITSLTNAALVPTAYTDQTIEVNELQGINIQLAPQGVGYTTTITDNDGAGFTLIGGYELQGTAPEVTGDNVVNPSDDYTVTVTRTNSYGSSTGTLTVRVLNLTAPATAISGFNHHAGSTSLVDSDTMADGSAIHMHNPVADGERLIIEKSYVETNILPALQGVGDKYYIGLDATGHDFTDGVDDSDFDTAIVWEYETANSHTFKFMRDGSVVNNIVVSSMTNAFYDFAIEINGTSAWLIACNVNAINTQPSPADGGQFSHTYEATNLDNSAPHTIHMAVVSTTGDFSTTGLSEITTPAAPVTSLTNWSKALDFSGSSERAVQVNNSANSTQPMRMGGLGTNAPAPTLSTHTSSASNARPWATAVVFKADGNSSNQHIWNLGEGAGSTDDNIYLRMDANRQLYFGWGRTGGLNECALGSTVAGKWYGVYVGHNGTRLYNSEANATNLAAAFDIRITTENNSWATPSYEYSTAANWTAGSTGGAMTNSFTGDLTIGGRGANRNFHGKVASFVTTTLKRNVAMPSDAEIEEMIVDPMRWLQDYKVGDTFRPSSNQSTTGYNFTMGAAGALSTQVWLMGDGTNDSYSNMIRNQVYPSDQNYTKLNLISMVSNDIENVTISGLS